MTNSLSKEGRVTAVYKAHTLVWSEGKTYNASVRGSFHTKPKADWPKVGDYVSGTVTGDTTMVIDRVLPRRTTVTRRVSFDDTLQVMVANVDVLCIVMGLDNDFNPRRLKRYIALAEAAEVSPLVVLTKADLITDPEAKKAEIEHLVPKVPVHVVSSVTGQGLSEIEAYLTPGVTMVLLGSSGAGKSSLINALMGSAVAAVGAVRRRDERGTHTTTRRQLHLLPNTAALIDTPGLRELAMEDEETTANAAYPAIAALTAQCRFSDCDHERNDGCAVQAAVQRGDISQADVAAFLKLKNREVRHRRTRARRPR